VAASRIVFRRADLNLHAMQVAVGVEDQRPDIVTDIEDDELGVRTGGVVLGRVLVAVIAVLVDVTGVRMGHGVPQLDGVSKPSRGSAR
jgi:hypothetical protein